MLNNLTTVEIVLVILVVTAIEIWIIYEIVKAATKSKKVVQLLEKQNYLLNKILENQVESKDQQTPKYNKGTSNPEGLADLNDPETLDKLLKGLSNK